MFGRSDIQLHIDMLTSDGGEICVHGWGCAPARRGGAAASFDTLSYSVLGPGSSPVASNAVSADRPDVRSHLGVSDGTAYGFRVTFRDDGSKYYKLRCLSPSGAVRNEKITRAMIEGAPGAEPAGAPNGSRTGSGISYNEWRAARLPSASEKQAQRNTVFKYAPVISIVVPLFRTPEKFLREMIASVTEQTYGNWQLCMADGSGDGSLTDILSEYSGADPRICFRTLDENLGISGNTNAAMELARGEYIALLDHDDVLEDTALYEAVLHLQEQHFDVIYTDEDKVSTDLDTYFEPHFKPDFSPDLLLGTNYICHFFIVKKKIAVSTGGFRNAYDGSQDYDFILRCTEQARSICHIPEALYHWRTHKDSTAANQESKMYCYEAGRKAVEDHLKRTGEAGSVDMLPFLGYYHVRYDLKADDMISVIIPNRDKKDVLKRCIDSVTGRTAYSNYEILIIENNSTEPDTFSYYRELENDPRIRVLTWEHGFNFAAINNFGARHARGKYILLLNNDTEVISPDWMEDMLSDAQRSGAGAVGAKLLYPDSTIQHAGVVIGLGGVAGHLMWRENKDLPGYAGRAIIRQDVSAVTGACMMISKRLYLSVGGMDEHLAVAYNDIDLCLRLRAAGKQNVIDPAALLFHHESLSRGTDDAGDKKDRLEKESALMRERWSGYFTSGDPFYNPNLSLCLQDGAFALREE